MSGNYTVASAFIDMFAAPGKAIDGIRSHLAWFWWPLLVVLLASAAIVAGYMVWVDFEWLIDQTVRMAVPPGGDPAIAESVRKFMNPTMMIASGLVGLVLGTGVIHLLLAVYLHLVNKVVGDPAGGFGQWFVLSVWAALPPGLFSALSSALVIATAESNQLPQDALNPLSLQSLIIHAEPATAWYGWGNALTVLNLWLIGLLTLGFMRWTGVSLGKSLVFVAAPWVLIFGGWAAVIA
ncbi:MAG TPA: hypothetical protein DDZ76_03725 [Xanthomonadales bacterium]|nr:hypothetical protein [Xanthomonadales bacterium]